MRVCLSVLHTPTVANSSSSSSLSPSLSLYFYYYSARVYKLMSGKLWKRSTVLTAMLYPVLMGSFYIFINFMVRVNIYVYVCLYVLLSLPAFPFISVHALTLTLSHTHSLTHSFTHTLSPHTSHLTHSHTHTLTGGKRGVVGYCAFHYLAIHARSLVRCERTTGVCRQLFRL